MAIGSYAQSRNTQKRLGIYYTPDWVARPLVAWALKPGIGPLLDPSFGGCAFLTAGLDHLESEAVSLPGEYLLGCDIDEGAAPHRERLIERGVPRANLLFGDFLTPMTQAWLGSSYACVVGNPPYLRHHILPASTIDEAQRLISACGETVPRLASAWAYFTILAAERVRAGGRIALVLPGAVLHADYGRSVIAAVTKRFASVQLLHCRERIFASAEEESVVLLASDRGTQSSHVSYSLHDSISQLLDHVRSAPSDTEFNNELGHKFALVDELTIKTWRNIRARAGIERLGNIADIRIGIVTGGNDFFIRSTGDRIFTSKHVLGRAILSRSACLTGPVFDRNYLARLDRENRKTRLAVIRSSGTADSFLRRELIAAEALGLPARAHCSRREPWYQIRDLCVPDLFLPYMTSEPRGLVVNKARALCSNSIHRVFLRSGDVDANVIAASSWSVLTAFEIELLGRNYGGSVLKIEPTRAREIAVATTPGALVLSDAETKVLRQGRLRLRHARIAANGS